ncbi:MAG: WHG domain-containing protein, partial [Rhodoferax sp.]|nr:WHG domain-containing protein [Rhodoferax sp.]
PTYYQIMFSRCVPGFTPPLASLQKSKASFEILVNGVQRCIDAQLVVTGDAREIAEVLWGTLHGIISLELFGYLGPSRMGEARLEQAIQTIKAGLTRHIA